jgi:hypothetical protein
MVKLDKLKMLERDSDMCKAGLRTQSSAIDFQTADCFKMGSTGMTMCQWKGGQQ